MTRVLSAAAIVLALPALDLLAQLVIAARP